MRIQIPLIESDLIIFIGNNDFQKFIKKVDNSQYVFNNDMSGYSVENYIWVHNHDRAVLLHELIHFLEWLYLHIGCENESEFKAYLGEYIIEKALKGLEKHRKRKGSK